MNLLFIGGTRFVGDAMAREAIARGHSVDIFHRGTTPAKNLEGAMHLHGDRVKDLSALATGRWDAVVDCCGYRPHEVSLMLDALAGRFAKYVFISSVSVYADGIAHNSDETAARADASTLDPDALETMPIDAASYGRLKVLCEDMLFTRHADNLVIRPTYVIGPHDYTPRFPEWVRRIAAGGEVLAPGPRHAAIQYVDARDLAAFTIGAIEQDARGPFNAASPRGPFGFGDMLDAIAEAVAPPGTTLKWLTPHEAKASGNSYPLWHEGGDYGVAAINSDAAHGYGLTGRPLGATARDVLAWLRASEAQP
ncbi:NAD-dependent epimerase/dehydratase family protein [Caenimonas koreensis]|uniref:NAD-dependent epimerase/dehydratase family protein n=1 Tax=Caenimonas koreensis TaxID=367474 RepID=UPI0037830306